MKIDIESKPNFISYNKLMTEQSITYTIVKRPVRRARLEFDRTGLRVIVPQTRIIDIPAFILQFRSWIEKKQKFYREISSKSSRLVLYNRSESSLAETVSNYLAEAEGALNVKSGPVRFRIMKRQWGNCTSKGRLTFNKKLAVLPDHLIRYIVYHEACHLKSMRHGKLFRKTMLKFFPNQKTHEQELSVYGFRLGIEE